MNSLSRRSFLSFLAAAPAAAMSAKLPPWPPRVAVGEAIDRDWEIAQSNLLRLSRTDPNYASNFLAWYARDTWRDWAVGGCCSFPSAFRRRHYTRLEFMRLHCVRQATKAMEGRGRAVRARDWGKAGTESASESNRDA